MTVPSVDDFIACLDLYERYSFEPKFYDNPGRVEGGSEDHIYWEATKSLFVNNEGEFERLLARAYEEMVRRQTEIHHTPVMRWLDQSPSFGVAINRMFPYVERIGGLSEMRAHRDIFVSSAIERLRPWAAVDGFRFNIIRDRIFSGPSVYGWVGSCVYALYEYHYVNSAELISSRRKLYLYNVENAIKAVEALQSLADDPIASSLFERVGRKRTFIKQFQSKRGNSEDMLSRLSEMKKFDPNILYPISRLDGTARARLFVYKMADTNVQHCGSAKAAVIAELMEIDGFVSRLDLRTIERQCANYGSMQQNYWRLLREGKT
ncbi:hypothetical protein L0Z31_17335 (plasmid) [Burkholderia vietnamiensis]|uniref:hypothetical protein n=2 Tax=Burkholderia vietnamiensis TaxID=60552 RepID=UPI0012D87894|nr:hypothetical protein [Burkholderia vietnamiensis]MCO1349229.1 hypothetical protein [Burkholderia vietnamiensis]MCO1431701.1 hypothetical protein [Burkholderia vietnamiensis]UQN45315.1 hypothetical protein L0Y95_07590 [Burkholderia vietnamiensis]